MTNGNKPKKIVYVVPIPWDACSIKAVRVFAKEEDARRESDFQNKYGGTGYINSVSVYSCPLE